MKATLSLSWLDAQMQLADQIETRAVWLERSNPDVCSDLRDAAESIRRLVQYLRVAMAADDSTAVIKPRR
jgi:hypothetical protein